MRMIQCVCVWFCMWQGDTLGVTFNKVKGVFGQRTYSKSTVYRLQKEYAAGRLKVGDLPRSGRPRSARTRGTIEVCKRAVQRDRRINIHRLTTLLTTSYGTVHRILHKELSLKKRASKYIPHILTEAQKCKRLSFAVNFLDSYPGGRRLHQLITTDESWFHVHDPDTKLRNMQWLAKGEDRAQVAHRSRSTKKVLMVPFFDIKGVVYVEYLLNGTVNKHVFKAMLQRAWESVRTRRGFQVWRHGDQYKLHMDNAGPHRALIMKDALRDMGWATLKHPPYSPDLSPCDFFLFPYLKRRLRGRNYQNTGNLLNAIEDELGWIPTFLWEGCFRQWCARCQKCILFGGQYFEGMRHPLS